MKAYNEGKEQINSENDRVNLLKRIKRSLSKKVEDEYIPLFPSFTPMDAGNELTEIEKKLRCKINCWRSFSVRSKWECVRVSPFMDKDSYDTEIDIMIEYSEIRISLLNVGLILEIDEFLPQKLRFKRHSWTIFESLAIFKHPELEETVIPLRRETRKLQEIWSQKSVHTIDSRRFYELFKVSPQIWMKKILQENDERTKIEKIKIFDRLSNPKLIGPVLYLIKYIIIINIILNSELS